ncbi:MAG: ATP-binding protein [Eubacterium sp.]|nr:ATP-binding protein [Eubacterium sp.]
MDTSREKYLRAKTVAERVLLIKHNKFLEITDLSSICINENSYIPRITKWIRVDGYRTADDESRTENYIKTAVSEWARATIGYGYSAAFTLKKNYDEILVLYGANGNTIETPFITNIPECNVHTTDWNADRYIYNGFMLGRICSKDFSDLFASSNVTKGYVSCVLIPISDVEVAEKLNENIELIAYLNAYKTAQHIYGNASRRVVEMPIQVIISAIDLLKKENEYLERNMGSGFFRTIIKFGANSQMDYRNLASLITSSMNYDVEQQNTFEPIRIINLHNECKSMNDCLAVPVVDINNEYYAGRTYALSLQDINSVVSFCSPPLHSYKGFYVKDYSIDESSRDIFPLSREVREDGICIGKLYGTKSDAIIPFSALHSHCLVDGSTETGKTTTVKKILTELNSVGIPFTVIEAAKKEYISLIGSVHNLKVYTPGIDGIKLEFNPLQTEEGTLIENHVAAVVRALVSSTGGEHPIPEAFDGLLKQTYHRYGWDYGMIAYNDEHKPFPTFKDVLENIDSYIENHARYGPEVKQNLTAALKLRSENLYSGALGNLFSKRDGLKAKDLLGTPSVIELTDFSAQSASFIMNILLFKFQCYLTRLPEDGSLRRVIVIEEAHNIFKKTISEDSGRALNNEYFDKMLSEIRSSGTGLILSDQRPSIISDAVIANTSVKISHALVDGHDREAVGIPSNLSESQMKRLGEFKIGECLISIRGYHGVQHTMVVPAKEDNSFNSSCHICASRFRCRKQAVKNMISSMDESLVAYHVSKIQSNPYNSQILEIYINNMLADLNVTATVATKVCLLGEILDVYSLSSEQEKRVITSSYSDYLRRET